MGSRRQHAAVGGREAFAVHGFIGIEAAVVDVIARWAAGEDVPAVVGR